MRAFNGDAAKRWIKPYLTKYKNLLVLAFVLGLLTLICSVMLMFTSGYLICRTSEPALTGIFAVMLPVAFVQVFGIGGPLARYFERLVSHNWVFRMTTDLRVRLYDIVEKGTAELLNTHGIGDYLGLIAEDIGHLQNLYLRTVFPTIIAWILYLVVVIALGAFDAFFALTMLLVFAVTIFVMPLVSLLVNKARIEQRKASIDDLYAELTDNVLGANDWIFAGRGKEYLENYHEKDSELRAAQNAIDFYTRASELIAAVIFAAGACLVLYWAGNFFEGSQGGQASWIAAFALGYFPLIEAFAPLSDVAIQGANRMQSIDKLGVLPEDCKDCALEKEDHTSSDLPSSGPVSVEFDDVTFSYDQDSGAVLENISLSIAAGQKVAIIGKSGSGKSTLVSLLRNEAQPDSGTVCIGSHSVCDLGDCVSEYLGFVQQQTYLFNMSLRENLRVGKPTASDEELWEVLKDVELEQMVRALPSGLDTIVDEAGKRFSGGERHRIALARVLLADTPLIVLDEPMVSLDPIVEKALLNTIMKIAQNRTLIMITHHLQGIELFDRVIGIESGGVRMDGSPLELSRNDEHFRTLLAFDKGLKG